MRSLVSGRSTLPANSSGSMAAKPSIATSSGSRSSGSLFVVMYGRFGKRCRPGADADDALKSLGGRCCCYM